MDNHFQGSMIKLFSCAKIIVLFTCILTACGNTTSSSGSHPAIYVSFVSHNERSPHLYCDSVTTDQSAYLDNRSLTAEFAQLIVDHNAAWDMQSDYQYLDAVQQWDSDSVMNQTDHVNIIRYLSTLSPSHIVVDAHAHDLSGPNYADVVYMLQTMGAVDHGVVGGFDYQSTAGDWPKFESPLAGSVFPDVAWNAEILWGAATLDHLGKDDVTSGIWHPDPDTFYTNNESEPLVYVGGYNPNYRNLEDYTHAFDGLDDLLSKLKSGTLSAFNIYTVTVFFDQCSMSQDMVDFFSTKISGYEAEVAAGNIYWRTIPDMVQAWKYSYAGKPSILYGQ